MGGVTVTPDFDYTNAPRLTFWCCRAATCGGRPGRSRLDQEDGGETEIVLTVFFGAMFLADTGLLDGIEATTHHWGIDRLREIAPKCKVVTGKRLVDSGK